MICTLDKNFVGERFNVNPFPEQLTKVIAVERKRPNPETTL
jgi:hypothetical protein